MVEFCKQNIKGVIFDLDETIIDSMETYVNAFNRGTAVFQLEPVDKELLAYFIDKGRRLGEILLELFPSAFVDDKKRHKCENEILKAYRELEAHEVMLKPAARQILQLLKEMGIKIGVFTGRTTVGELKWLELKRLNVHQFIDAFVTGAEALPKPAPDGLIKCIGELGLSPDECIFVGDSTADIIASKKADVKIVVIRNGLASKEFPSDLTPDYVMTDLSMLLSYLNEPHN